MSKVFDMKPLIDVLFDKYKHNVTDENEILGYVKRLQQDDVYKKNSDGATLFQLASLAGHLNVLKYLVDKYDDIDKNVDYVNLIEIIIWWNECYDAIPFLLERGNISVNHQNSDGYTLLYQAIIYRIHTVRNAPLNGILKMLLELGADPNIQTNNGKVCVLDPNLNVETIQLLLDYGAEVKHGKQFEERISYDSRCTRPGTTELLNKIIYSIIN